MKRRLFISLIIYIAALASLSAASWSGLYRWDNPTTKDNGGKMKSLQLSVVESEDSWKKEIYLVEESGEYRIYPLEYPSSSTFGEWHKYKEKSDEGETFRHNNNKINTSSFSPGKWKMEGLEATDSQCVSSITVSAFSFKVLVTTTFTFSLDENGREQLTFWMDTDKDFADGMFFTNPDPQGDGKFVLKKIN